MRWGVILRWSRCRSRLWSLICSRRRCSTLRMRSSESKNRWPVQRADVAQSSRLSGSATSKICWALVARPVGNTRPRCSYGRRDANVFDAEEVSRRSIVGFYFQGALAAFGLAVGHAGDGAGACAAEEVPRRGRTGAYFQGELVAHGHAVSSATTPAVVLYIQGPLVARSFAVGLPLMMPTPALSRKYHLEASLGSFSKVRW